MPGEPSLRHRIRQRLPLHSSEPSCLRFPPPVFRLRQSALRIRRQIHDMQSRILPIPWRLNYVRNHVRVPEVHRIPPGTQFWVRVFCLYIPPYKMFLYRKNSLRLQNRICQEAPSAMHMLCIPADPAPDCHGYPVRVF